MSRPTDPDSLRAFLVDMMIGLIVGMPLAIGLWVATVIVVMG
jgi:hypothetical protein